MTKLWVDDEREGPPGWAWARTYSEAAKIILGGSVTHLSLDHDLGDTELGDPSALHGYDPSASALTAFTGYHLALLMVREGIHPEEVTVHSMNGVGSEQIVSLLNRHRPEGSAPVRRRDPRTEGPGPDEQAKA